MNYERKTWRVIEHPPAKGAWNMAVDEAILESVYSGDSPPTLRLYAWQPACLSLGHAQPYAEVNTEALAANGWELVRRPTGGRAILHVDELTYAVIAPEREPRVKGGVLESYLRLSQALIESLRLLGLSPQAEEKKSGGKKGTPNPVCFEVPSNYEITVNGKKLIGSAQARRKEGILQHGTLPLYGDLARIITALQFPNEADQSSAKDRLLAHATTVENELGRVVTWQQACHAVQQAFSKVLNLDLEPEDLTEKEIERAKALQKNKYAHSSWTERI
ncbi:MAG: biotin/lipoate A/B protein ligase family protein [Chloroflexota bacterium]|nr:biotin/lipoate A/B protein ligase family protein [Chloroflexota bacterium]